MSITTQFKSYFSAVASPALQTQLITGFFFFFFFLLNGLGSNLVLISKGIEDSKVSVNFLKITLKSNKETGWSNDTEKGSLKEVTLGAQVFGDGPRPGYHTPVIPHIRLNLNQLITCWKGILSSSPAEKGNKVRKRCNIHHVTSVGRRKTIWTACRVTLHVQQRVIIFGPIFQRVPVVFFMQGRSYK